MLAWLLGIYLAGAGLSIVGLVVCLWLYERRLHNPRPFNKFEQGCYVLGILFDQAFNLLTLSTVFLEPPRSLRETASRRFLRHMPHPGYRGAVARLCWRLFIHPVAPRHRETVLRNQPVEEDD